MKGKLFLSVIVFVLSFPFITEGQRLFPVYSQYMMNGLALNPAYAGSRDAFNVTLSHRTQWVGMDGAPVSFTLSSHAPMKKDKVALGIFLFNETIDIRNNLGLYGTYAYRLNLKRGKLSFGLKAGVDIQKSDWTRIQSRPFAPTDDPVFANNAEQYYIPNFGFGIYYYTQKFYIGASIPGFLSDSLALGKTYLYHNFENYNYLFTTGFVTGGNFFKVRPSVLVKYNQNNPIQADFNLSFIFGEFLWIGGSYRMEDAVVGLVKFQVSDQIRIGYTYDYSLGKLNQVNNGSHEIVLIYDFKYRVKGANPRYF